MGLQKLLEGREGRPCSGNTRQFIPPTDTDTDTDKERERETGRYRERHRETERERHRERHRDIRRERDTTHRAGDMEQT